jgi:asparagine synthase (glutamine-hydrolysing)
MCGIAGYFLDEAPKEPSVLEKMTRTLAHRGPDGEGFFRESGTGLGHRRLSIIDLEGGAQPIFNEDGSVAVIFNGEIYNFKALRARLEEKGHRFKTRSDTEVIVHLYEDEGESFLPKLNGIFAFALYDRKRGTLLLARDPLGVKPLYYAKVSGGIVFGSELKAILAFPGFDNSPDLEALASFLTCEYVPAPLTAYKSASKLLPGHLLLASHGGIQTKSYWQWKLPVALPAGSSARAELLRDTVFEAVKGQLVSDVPLGLFLSGGVDSSVVAACMKRAGGEVRSFSIGFEDPSFDESVYAREAANHLGLTHNEQLFTERELVAEVPHLLASLDEPFADPSVFPTALLSRFTRQQVTVALGGDGGDELFAGYPTYWVHSRYGLYRALWGPARRAALTLADRLLPVSHANLTLPYKLRKFRDGAELEMPGRHLAWLGAWPPGAIARLMPELKPGPATAPVDWMPSAPANDPVTKAQWLDLHTYLLEDILAKVDRATMMASLEARVPLLDPAVVRLAFSLAPEERLKGRRGKHLLKEAFARDFPPGFLDRPKKGFGIPMARWLCGPLKPFAEELLSGDVLGRVPFLDPKEPRRLWHEHLAMKADHRKPLWTILCLLEWWRRHER